MGMSHEERIEYFRKYRADNYEKLLANRKKYYLNNKSKCKKYARKYYCNNIERIATKKYYAKGYSRFISLDNYLKIAKLDNESLKRSLMTKLGRGIINEDEAMLFVN